MPRVPRAGGPEPTPGTAGVSFLPSSATLSDLVGRDAELAEAVTLLDAYRLVTLTGVGGCGKTRLGIAVAQRLAPRVPGGVWFVDLTAVATPALVPDAVAGELGVREEPGVDLADTLAGRLRDRELLLVLDNCEHVREACASLVGRLLSAGPALRVLATSRVRLRVPDEAVLSVPALPVPDPATGYTLAGLADVPSVRLFMDRAWERTGRRPTESDAPVLARVCAVLEGLPLAIELAAARTAVISVNQIADRLGDRFALLRGTGQVNRPHHRTLRTTLDWSYDLLGPQEQTLLARLAVFVGGFTREAAEALWPDPLPEDGPGLGEVLDTLVAHCLVSVEERDGRPWYRLLETIRAYAADRLGEAGPAEREAAQARHAAYYLALVERADSALLGTDQARWVDRMVAEHDNVRAAMSWLAGRPDTHDDLRLALASRYFMFLRGYYRELQTWLTDAAQRRTDAPADLRGTALAGAAVIAHQQGRYQRAELLVERGLALLPPGPATPGRATLLSVRGYVARDQGRYADARRHFEAMLDGYDTAPDERFPVWGLLDSAQVAWLAGDLDAADGYLRDLRPLLAAYRDPTPASTAQYHQAAVAFYRGDGDRARDLLADALAACREIDHKQGVACVLNLIGLVELAAGRHGAAEAALSTSVATFHELGRRWRLASALEAYAALHHATGDPYRAARLLGAAETIRAAMGTPVPACEQPLVVRTRAGLREAIGATAYDAEVERGRAAELSAVVAGTEAPAPRPAAADPVATHAALHQ